MKITRITYCFFLVLVAIGCLGSRLNAQDFSVRVGVTIVTPSPYLEEYAEGNNLLVTVTLVADRPTRDGILKLSLTNGDFTATTRNGIPLTLTRGVPLILRGPQLRDLLDLNNLDISGFGIENTVENGGRLPEGLINICGEFFAINFPDQPISNTGCGSRFVLPNDPPQLNLPFEDAAVAAPQEITPFNFNWSPRHYQQPTDRYVLELFELVPGLSWDQVISSSLLYRSAPERRFLLAYNPLLVSSQPQLEIGKRYLWRVRIQDINPASDRTFVNFGYSQPQAFTYGTEADITAACPQVARFFAQGLGAHTGELGWEMANTERLARAELRYRVIDGTWSNPEEVSATGSPYPLNDLMPATAYEAELCLNCTAGNKSCETVSFTTLTEEEDCGPLVAPVAVPLSETSLALRWPVVTQATGFTLSWGATTVSPTDTRPSTPTRQQQRLGGIPRQELPSPGTRDRADENTSSNNRGGPDSLQLAAGSTEAIIGGLAIGTSYDFRFCKQCPDGSRECYEWTENFAGIDDACLTNLDVFRTDSSDTTLELAWTYTGTVPDSFQFIWQVSDGSYPADTATVAYADSSYTITERIPGLVYTLKVCAECTSGQPVCRDLPPFGGCVAEYTPELVDATSREALLGWPVEGETVTTQLRYRMRAFGGWDDAPVGELRDFSGGDYPYSDEQLAQTQRLRPQLVYLAQVRTQCFDTLWSAWSEPVRFSLACTLDEVDTLTVLEVTDSSAYISAFSIANAVHYSFEYRLTGTETWTVSEELEESNLTLTGLSADTEYEVRMRYFCSRNAWSDYSQIQTFRTLPPCGMPMDIAYTDITFNSAQINWTPGENALETKFIYRLLPINRGYYLTAPGAWEEAVFPGNNELLNQLEDGLAYEIKALTNCGVNESPATPFDTLRLACAPPEVLVSDVSIDAATVALTGPTGYTPGVRFSYRKLGEEEWAERNGYSGFAFGYLTELDDYSTYELRGRYDCPSGETAPWSDTLQFTTPVDCRVPENLGVVDLMTDGADLRWDVTGTVTEWEVCLLEQDPQAQQQATMEGVQRQQMSTDGEEEAGGGGSLNGDQNIGGGGDRGPGNTGPATPPDPYANWQRFTVTDPGKLLAGLRANMNYKVVVRASCPVEGWTDYSEELAFRTLCPSQAPDTAYADQMLASSAVLNWSRVYLCAETYSVVLESLEPLPVTNTTTVSDPFGRVGNASADGETAIYRDSTITDNTSATFGNLLANKEYRFRVRTRTTYNNFVPAAAGYTTMADVGADAGARIVGASGYSEYTDWYTFRTDHCAQPYDIIENPVDRTTMEISWTPSNGVNNYRVDYRLLQDGAQPAYELTSEAFVRLTPLISNGVYEYSVTELCQNGEDERGSPQDTFRLKRPSIQNGFYVCGVQTEVNTDNMTPLQVLAVGDTIRAYDFPVVITEVSGSGGNFSGLGEIRMPYFNKAKFAFAFEGIFVNDDYQMADGYLEATGFGVEVLPPWADELLGEIMGALQMLDAYTQDQQLELLDSLMACCPGSVPPALQQRIFNIQNCYAQQDESNNPNYSLCEDMLDDLMASIDSLLNSIYGGTFQVQFAPDPEQSFGFDGWQSNYPEEWYEVEELAGEDYILAYKSTKLGATDKVRAVLPTPAHTDSVGFELPDGSPPAYTFDGNQALIQFANTHPAGDDYFIAASQLPVAGDTTPPYVAGLLNVIPYPELPLNVTLVPLSSAAATGLNAASIRQGLAGILGQALVEPSVFVDDVFTTNYGAPLDAVESGLLTNYNGEMRDIIAAYSEQEAITNDRYYLFVLAEADYEDIARSGFMPRGRQFGFLYRGNIDGDAAFTRTLAHELAHGAYVLKHTWDEYPDAMPEGATQNLMDKQGGTELLKWQWDLVHDPVGAPLLPGDESGEYVVPTDITSLNGMKQSDVFVFSDPTGRPIILPGNITGISFYSGDELSDEVGFRGRNDVPFRILPIASVRNFTLSDGTVYVPNYSLAGADVRFLGYCKLIDGETSDCISYNDLVPDVTVGEESGVDSIGLAFPCYDNARIGIWAGLVDRNNFEGIASGSQTVMNYDALISLYREIGSSFGTVMANTYTGAEGVSGLTAEAEQFLNFLSDKINTCNSPASAYAFVHAHQISKYPDFYRNCEGVVFDQLVRTKQDWIDYLKKKALSLAILPISPSTTFLIGYYQGVDDETILSGEEVEVWKNADVSFYHYFSEESVLSQPPSSPFWTGLRTDQEDSDDHARKLVFEFMNAFDSPCQFESLHISNRIKALRLLSELELEEDNLIEIEWNPVAAAIPGMSPYIFNDDTPTEKLFNIVLGSGNYTKFQAELIVNLFKTVGTKDGYQVLNGFYYQIVDQMFDSDFLNDPNYEQFATILGTVFLQSTAGRPSMLYESNIDGSTNILPPQNITIASHKVLHLPNCCSISMGGTTSSQSFSGSSSVVERTNIRHSIRRVRYMNNTQVSDNTTISHDVTGNPFDFVVIVNHQESIAFSGPSGEPAILSPGDTLIVPLFLAQSFYQKFETAEIKLKLRVGVDLAVTCISFGTASVAVGGWRLLSLADAAYSAVDIVFAADEYDMALTGEGNLPQQLHQIWAGIGIGLVAANVTQFVRTVAGANVSRVRMRMVDDWIEHVRTSVNSSDEYLAVITDTRNRVRQFIQALENATDAPGVYNWRADEYYRLIRDSKAAYVALSESMGLKPPINVGGGIVLRSKHRLDLETSLPGLTGDTYAGFMGPSASAPLTRAWYYGPLRYVDDGDAVLLSEKLRWSILPDPNLRGVRTGMVQGTGEAAAVFGSKLMIYRNVATGQLEYYAIQVDGVAGELITAFNVCQRYGLSFEVYKGSVSQFLNNKTTSFIRLWADKLDGIYLTHGQEGITAFFDEILRSSDQNLLSYFDDELQLSNRIGLWTQLYEGGVIAGLRKKVHWIFAQDIDGLSVYLRDVSGGNQLHLAQLYDSWPNGQAGLARSNALRAAILDASTGLGAYLKSNMQRAKLWDIIAGDLTSRELVLARNTNNIDALDDIKDKFKFGSETGSEALKGYFSDVPSTLADEAVAQIKVSNQLESGTNYNNAIGNIEDGFHQVELIGESSSPNLFRGVKYYPESTLPTVSEFETALEALGGIYRDINPGGPGYRMVLGTDPVVDWGNNYAVQANSLDIHVHGDYDPVDGAFYIYIKKSDTRLRVKLTPYQLADHIKNIDTYRDVAVVRLFACYGSGGGQEIANILDKPVITGTEPIQVYPNGNMYINNGTLVKYVSGSAHPDLYDLFLLEGWDWALYNRDLDGFFAALTPENKQEVINGLRVIPDGSPGNSRYAQLQQKWIEGVPGEGISPASYRSGFSNDPLMIQAFDIVLGSRLVDDLPALSKIANHIRNGANISKLQLDFNDIFATADPALLNLWVNTLGDQNFLVLRRGTNLGPEMQFFDETGHVLSDAARYKYYQLSFSNPSPSVTEALQYSNGIHQEYLAIFNGDINAYAQAHAQLGGEMESTYGLKRTLISTTSDPSIINNFYTPGLGAKYVGVFRRDEVIRQTLPSSGESEYLLINGSNLMKKVIE